MSIDLAFTLVVAFVIFFLGSIVYFNDRKSVTNAIFFYVALSTVFWALSNYFSLNPVGLDALYFIRLVLFFAVPHVILFVLFVYNFPNQTLIIRKSYLRLAISIMVLTMALALSPFVFSHTETVSNNLVPQPGILIPIFAFVIVGSLLVGLFLIIKKYLAATTELKKKWLSILLGFSTSYVLLILTQFIFVSIKGDTSLVLYAPLFMLPTFIGVAYASMRYKLLEAKALVVESLIFILLLLTLFELLLSTDIQQIIFRSILFTSFFIIGIFLIKAVLREVVLRQELQVANEGQENLIHIMNHQIKGYLGKARAIFAELMRESAIETVKDVKPMLDEGFRATTEGVDFIQQVLNGSNAARGTLTYDMKPLDFRGVVEEAVKNQVKDVAEKGLSMDTSVEDGDYKLIGDLLQLKEAVRNLVDNSIKYTQKGGLTVRLENEKGKVLLSVHDTGVGVNKEDMPKLFTKGGKGKDSLKYNVNSTGYGLAFVKGVVEAHKGLVWAESEGPGKGSTFYMELPLVG